MYLATNTESWLWPGDKANLCAHDCRPDQVTCVGVTTHYQLEVLRKNGSDVDLYSMYTTGLPPIQRMGV